MGEKISTVMDFLCQFAEIADEFPIRVEHPTFGGSDFWTIASVYKDINGVVNIVVGDHIEKAV